MSNTLGGIKCGDWVGGVDHLGDRRHGRVIEISRLSTPTIQIVTPTGHRCWLRDESIEASIFQSPKYFCASRQPKEGHELMLVQREGEVVLTKDGKDLLKFVNGQEGFVVLEG